jgi:adenine-specific DNA methylase
MSQEQEGSRSDVRTELPIERGFPIERINEIAEKEGRARQHYRPIYTMHKWWARRPGSLFRAISLYTLLDQDMDEDAVEVYEPGQNGNLNDFGGGREELKKKISDVNIEDPESLWEFYRKDVRVKNKKILDPFMGGGTSLVEASRFGVESEGWDLNPVAWFITKKELEAGQTDVEDLMEAFDTVEQEVEDRITQYYKTECPHGDHEADVMYNFWAKELDCISCGNTVPLFKDYRVAKGRYENDDKYNVFCPSCESIILVDGWREECSCSECGFEFVPEDGTVDYGDYVCSDCGQRYSITEQIQDRGGFDIRLYALEYYCSHCDERGASRSQSKGYKIATPQDQNRYEQAKEDWESSEDLKELIPDKNIRAGWKTDANQFEGSIPGNGNLPRHGITKWTDMFNERQLLSLSVILEAISEIEDDNCQELLLLAFSDSLNFNNFITDYQESTNKIQHLFKTNSFDPPQQPCEANPWGTKYGMGSFKKTFELVKKGVEYARAPTDRYIENGETRETDEFSQPIGLNSEVYQGDMRHIDAEDEYDAVITDPSYYNNILYSELSDYYYVWLKPVLEDRYESFQTEHTPRAESIVVNPAAEKGDEEFETELKQAFDSINTALKKDGVVAFTYHHSSSESWGELLESLCETGFEVTATYPINSDLHKFTKGETVSFDIVIVARPTDEREPISWRSLRRDIRRTANVTRNKLEESRDLSAGDIGVIEMGECFAQYSKHHGKVQRDRELMSAKEIVDEIYGIIQEDNDYGEIEVFLDLLELSTPTYNDLNKLSRGTNATPEEMKEMKLFHMKDNELTLGTWRDEKRQAYIQDKVGSSDHQLNSLDKAQFLRYLYEEGKSSKQYLEQWSTDDDLRKICEDLADATNDDTYRKLLGENTSLDDI